MQRSKSFTSIEILNQSESHQIIWNIEGSSARDSLRIVESEIFDEEVQQYQSVSHCVNLTDVSFITSNESYSSLSGVISKSDGQLVANELISVENELSSYQKTLKYDQKWLEDRKKKQDAELISIEARLERLRDGKKKFQDWVNSVKAAHILNLESHKKIDATLTHLTNLLSSIEWNPNQKHFEIRQNFDTQGQKIKIEESKELQA